jgi:hypothetical protein
MELDTLRHYDELMSQIKIVKDRVRGVIHGRSNGLYLHGRPGTSKTHMVLSTLDICGVSYAYNNGHLTPIGLYDLIAEHRDRIIVIDDIASIFNQPISLGILLAALGNPHSGSRTRIVSYKTARESRSVPFSGGIICLSNLALDGHHQPILAALRDRIYVLNYEPTDEQIISMIYKLADDGIGGMPSEDAKKVAFFLIEQCQERGVRPSVRLFVDKALKDFQLWTSEACETHWRDLIVSNLEQQLVELQHEVRDLSRAEQIEAERRIVLDIVMNCETREGRIAEWMRRTGKRQAAFYRRFKELREEGRLQAISR